MNVPLNPHVTLLVAFLFCGVLEEMLVWAIFFAFAVCVCVGHTIADVAAQSPLQMEENTPDKSMPETAGGPNKLRKIFYLNLTKHVSRNEHMQRLLSGTGIPFERIEAVTFSQVDRGDYDYLLPRGNRMVEWAKEPNNPRRKQFERSVGCDVAHRKAYHRIAQMSGDGLYLILEDDVELKQGWKHELAMAFPFLPDDWTMARLGYWGWEKDSDKINPFWYRASRHHDDYDHKEPYYYGAHAILLTPSHARKLLDRVTQFPANYADYFTGVWTGHTVIQESYVLVANVIVPAGFTSTKNPQFPTLEWADSPAFEESQTNTATPSAATGTNDSLATAAAATTPATATTAATTALPGAESTPTLGGVAPAPGLSASPNTSSPASVSTTTPSTASAAQLL